MPLSFESPSLVSFPAHASSHPRPPAYAPAHAHAHAPAHAPAHAHADSEDDARRLAIARSRYAETIVQAAYGCRGRRRGDELIRSIGSRGRALIASDGLVETLVTLLATILFGLSWASIEMRSSDAALRARHDALVEAYTAETSQTSEADSRGVRPGLAPIGVGVETGYAAVGVATLTATTTTTATTPFILDGAADTQWTEKPHARSKR